MIDLIIHVGLPKTATTLVQKLMSEFPNYVGLESAQEGYTLELLDIYASYSLGKDVQEKLINWSSSMIDYVSSNNIVSPLVVSSEFFFAGEFTGAPEFPLIEEGESGGNLRIAEFLGFISCFLKSKFSVNVLLTIRNQPEWLASKYAQAAPKIYGASQEDFDSRIERYSKLDNKLWCDWGGVVKIFDEELGKNNVYVLCMEDMGKDEFWESLSFLFTGSMNGVRPYRTSANELASINRKRKNSTEWGCGAFEFGSYLSKKYRVLPGSRKHRFIVRFGNALSRIGLVLDSKRKDNIFLSSTTKSSIGGYCGSGNLWLENRLNKNLREIGYPVSVMAKT